MLRTFQRIFPIYLFIDLIIITLIYYISYVSRYNTLSSFVTNANYPHIKEYIFIYIVWLTVILTYFKKENLYATDRGLTIPKEVRKVVASIIHATILISAVIFFAQYKFFSRVVFINNFIISSIALSGWRIAKRLALRKLISEGFHNVNVLIIGAGSISRAVISEAKRNRQLGFNIVGFLDDKKTGDIESLPVMGTLDSFTTIVKKHFIDEIIITIPSERRIVSDLIQKAKKMRIGLRIIPENFDEPSSVLNVSHIGDIPLLTYKERVRHPAELALKRLFDCVISLISLILLFPLFVIIATIIKLDSHGSIFYIQKRIGLKGRSFNFYKFRSMRKNADDDKAALMDKNEMSDGIMFKIKKDPRVTQIGRLLRKYSLDELPQLMNVLKGDMSLIGPRPPLSDEVNKYTADQMQRLSIRPGMTGLSQVKGRSNLAFKKWVKWDLWYIDNWSFWLDMRILWWTIPVAMKGKGAY